MISPSEDKRKAVVNKMLSYDNEVEELEDPFLNVRVMAIDSYFYKGLRDQLYKTFQSGASRILYEMGLGYGEIMGKMIEEQGKGRLEYYKDFIERGKYHGMGHFQVPMLTAIISGLKGEAVIRVKRSFLASSVGETGFVECYIFAGQIAGAARVLMKKEYNCIETKCTSRKDEYCEFRLRESSE
ncbi:MAG: V4R domain-containing protein [Nitrososphaerales archaeon]